MESCHLPCDNCARVCQELHLWAAVLLHEAGTGGQAALERAVDWSQCSAPHKPPGEGVLVITSPRRLFCMPLASLPSLDLICSDWLSSHTPQAVLLEVEQSAFNIHLWDWVSKLAQPLKYRSYKGCVQRPICWDNASWISRTGNFTSNFSNCCCHFYTTKCSIPLFGFLTICVSRQFLNNWVLQNAINPFNLDFYDYYWNIICGSHIFQV